MSTNIQRLLAEITHRHFPNPPATPAQIVAFEERVGWKLDEDLRAFYLHCDGAALFRPWPDTNFWILPLAQVRRGRVAIQGRDADANGPPDWYALVDLQDTDFILVDVSQRRGPYPMRDGYHGTFPDPVHTKVIAPSFSEFLENALASEDDFFWLDG
ncbi:SMI1/KNR4 family protein [Corallococcus exiguus]|uniref:SMI1/KNR4 family protein n=1 Tax=Corallococcus TaxID=83461 RepID=UPI000ECFDD2B|nr:MULTISPECIES: SMI1/KNR4 family protein [Corallococcus]NNB87409.1 SMI1/KNR4 family protein [Corallococcus exiguus]NNB97218.1 SMI1/KNR4 family protein [Corallococcus exiguus]NPC48993.1 SMI1/KNR4 family protein [Corallococcus exiguus]RKH84053.1 SMI1/KNR4 family protein [Corallococcus sp. AB032C]